MPDRIRALFVNEGSLGDDVMGPLRAADSLTPLDAEPLDARVRTLPPMNRLTQLAVAGVPGLERLDLDGHTVRWHLVQSLRARATIRHALAGGPADVIHLHSHSIGLLSVPHMRAVPTVLSLDATVWQWHAMGIWRDVWPWSRAALGLSLALERRAFAAARMVIAPSRWTQAGVYDASPKADVRLHYPGLDLDRFRPAASRPGGSRLKVLFVGARFAAKGGEDLLAALGPRLGSDVELDVVTSIAPVVGAGVRCHRLAPGDPRLAELFREADVFCMPTYGDGVPWAVLEAMASGVPVVAGDVGAIGELLDGRAGRLVAPGDVPALRTTLDTLLDDAALRRELGEAGRALCERRHDRRRQFARLVELVAEATGARS